MSRYAKTILAVLSLFTASTALAADYSDLYVMPIAGHARGAFETAWRSDVVLHNLQLEPITVEMALIESGRPAGAEAIAVSFGAETVLHLAAGETRVISDVLGNLDRDVTGALIVGASMPFVLTSRTYAERPAGRTLGQTVLPIAISGGNTTAPPRSIALGMKYPPRALNPAPASRSAPKTSGTDAISWSALSFDATSVGDPTEMVNPPTFSFFMYSVSRCHCGESPGV